MLCSSCGTRLLSSIFLAFRNPTSLTRVSASQRMLGSREQYISFITTKGYKTRNEKATRQEQCSVKEGRSGVSSETVPSEFLRNTHKGCAVRVAKCQEELETMQLDGVLGDTLFGQEVLNLNSLVALELDDLASLLIFDEGTVASKFLLEGLEELPRVVFLGETL